MSYNDEDDSYDFDDYGDEEETYPEFGDEASFELFEILGGDAQAHGALKSFETKDGGLIYYKDDKTGFTISVERLLQADGYADDTKQQRLTLFVLKIVLACNSDSRIKRAVFSMNFEDLPDQKRGRNKGKDGSAKVEPQIVAWAPFDDMAKTNQINANRKKGRKTGCEAGGEGAGVRAKAMEEWESTIEWTETYWETGNSYPTFGSDQTRNGVRWVLNANPKDTQGLPPKLTVGILLSRQSDEPYLVNFDINVTGGLVYELRKNIEKLVGRRPEVTKPYKVTPSEKPICRATGSKMLSRVNLLSMLELQGEGDDLVLIWNDGEKKENADKAGDAEENKAAD